jgi:hypothetical protein
VRKHYGWIGLYWHRGWLVVGSCIRIAMFAAASLLPGRREAAIKAIRKWSRVLFWTIGWRGPGLEATLP